MTAACLLPWCIEHDHPDALDPGVTVHWSRTLGRDPVPLRLSRYDETAGSGRVQIQLDGEWLTPAQARRLADALREVAEVAERS